MWPLVSIDIAADDYDDWVNERHPAPLACHAHPVGDVNVTDELEEDDEEYMAQ